MYALAVSSLVGCGAESKAEPQKIRIFEHLGPQKSRGDYVMSPSAHRYGLFETRPT